MVDLILRHDPLVQFSNGTIEITKTPTIFFWQSNPVIGSYLDLFTPENYDGQLPYEIVRPLDFRAGRIDVYIPNIGQTLVMDPDPTEFNAGSLYIEVGTVPDVGAFSEFGVWSLTTDDPAQFYAEGATAGTSGHTGEAWTRHSAVFAVPNGLNKAYPKAAYVAIGGRFLSVPDNGRQYVKKVMLEPLSPGSTTPTSYSGARQVQATIRPDRLNFVVNPSFETNNSSWSLSPIGFTAATSLATSAVQAKFGSQSGLVTWPTASSPVSAVSTNIQGLVVGRTYTASAWVFVPSGSPNVRIDIFATKQGQTTTEKDRWVRISVKFTATQVNHSILIVAGASTTGQQVYIDGVMCEAGEFVKDYFDGSFGPDYLWETGGTAHAARSYFYKNRAERYAMVKKILEQNVPLGITVADPKFAVLPVE